MTDWNNCTHNSSMKRLDGVYSEPSGENSVALKAFVCTPSGEFSSFPGRCNPAVSAEYVQMTT